MKFWHFKIDPPDVVVAPDASAATWLRERCLGVRTGEKPSLMTRAELDEMRPVKPLLKEDDFEDLTIGDYLDRMDAAAAEKQRIAEFEAKQVPLFPEEP